MDAAYKSLVVCQSQTLSLQAQLQEFSNYLQKTSHLPSEILEEIPKLCNSQEQSDLESQEKALSLCIKCVQNLSQAPLATSNASGKDTEVFLNYLVMMILSCHKAHLSQHIQEFQQFFESNGIKNQTWVASLSPFLKLKVLLNLYYGLSEPSAKFPVLMSILKLSCSTSSTLPIIQTFLEKLSSLFGEWNTEAPVRQNSYAALIQVFLKSGHYKYLTLTLNNLLKEDGLKLDQPTKSAILQAFSQNLSSLNPEFSLSFSMLFEAKELQADPEIASLLELYQKADFKTLFSRLSPSWESQQVDTTKLFKLLALTYVCSSHVGSSISFHELSQQIPCQVEEIEDLLLCASLEYHLLHGKIDEAGQTFSISAVFYNFYQDPNSTKASISNNLRGCLSYVDSLIQASSENNPPTSTTKASSSI